jgi:2'-5' RNA ligase
VSGGLRLFIAVEPPQAVRDELARWARNAIGRSAGARRISAESLHLTLCFLGEQPPAAVGEIAALMAGAVELFFGVAELQLGAPVWFPPRRPRVLAVEVGDPDATLRALQSSLAGDLAASLAWKPERERFRPHITLARMRPGSELARELPPTPALSFTPETLTLFRSELEPSGAVYTPLASVPPG